MSPLLAAAVLIDAGTGASVLRRFLMETWPEGAASTDVCATHPFPKRCAELWERESKLRRGIALIAKRDSAPADHLRGWCDRVQRDFGRTGRLLPIRAAEAAAWGDLMAPSPIARARWFPRCHRPSSYAHTCHPQRSGLRRSFHSGRKPICLTRAETVGAKW